MAEIVYYVAASIDGYIATSDGGVEWLPSPEEGEDYGYSEFYASVDAVLMGRHTYEQVLAFGEWPYVDKPCWVFSQRSLTPHANVILTSSSPTEVVAELESRQFKRVWLVGGGRLAASFRSHGLISEYIISVIPTLLGAGIPLLANAQPDALEKLTLAECKPYADGVVMLRYVTLAGCS